MCLGVAILALLSSSCSKDDVYPYDRVTVSVGESEVVVLDNSVEIFEDGVRLLYEDTEVCKVSDISAHQVTVTGLHRGADILHIEYATKRSKTGYSAIEIPVHVN